MCWNVEGARWVAEFTFELEKYSPRKLDALIAELRGRCWTNPCCRISGGWYARPVTLGMDDYADEVGLTFFDDHYDFDDDTNDDGFDHRGKPAGRRRQFPLAAALMLC